ncbi:MAG: hypothetical protein ACLGI6_08000, partial [Gammaproteobacteria bacterium]
HFQPPRACKKASRFNKLANGASGGRGVQGTLAGAASVMPRPLSKIFTLDRRLFSQRMISV